MAKFRQRGKTWSYHIYLGIDPLSKKRKEISKGGFKTQREAKGAARLIELEIQNGTFIKESDMPFEQFAQDWLKTYGRSGVKISSVRVREKEMKHFTSAWGPYPISRITKKMYEERILELNEKYSQNYMDGIHACGRMIFRKALHQGLIKNNPTEDFKMPKSSKVEKNWRRQKRILFFLKKKNLPIFLN